MSEMSSTQYIKKLVAVKFLRSIGYDIITKQEHDILIMVRMNNQQLTAERDAWKADAERLAERCLAEGSCCELHTAWTMLETDDEAHSVDCPITLHQLLIEEDTK